MTKLFEITSNSETLATPTSPRQTPETLDIVLYWRAIAKRKWSILLLAAAIAAVTGGLVSMMTPIYRSTATVLVEQNKTKIAPTEEVYASGSETQEHFLTQAEILKSRALAARVVEKLDLTHHRQFDPRQQKPPLLDRVKAMIGLATVQHEYSEQQLHNIAVDVLLAGRYIEPVRLSQLIRVSFDSSNPALAANIANAIAETYIESDRLNRGEMNERASQWLGDRLAGLKKNLEDSESALQRYREQAHLADTKGLAQSGATRQVEDLMTRLVAARQRRFAAEYAYRQVTASKGDLDVLPIVSRNGLVQKLKEVENEAEKRRNDLLPRYGPEHVRVQQAEAELRQARESTRRQVEAVAASVRNEYELARVSEQELDKSVSDAKAAVQDINRKGFDLASLERAVATNRQIYDVFLNRFRETRASRDMQASEVGRITEHARPAHDPVKPKRQQIISIALVAGLLLGGVIALLLERLDNTVKSADDVEDKLGEPLLALLPLLHGRDAQSVGRHYVDKPRSIFSEAIRTARTGILLPLSGEPRLTLLVTSSVPSEGKTAVAANLAAAYAQSKRVILIDADLRRPALASHLALDPRKPGLTDLLSGAAKFQDCVQRLDGTQLFTLNSGPVPLNPLELIISRHFGQLLQALASACDVLVIDSPPVHLVSDALVLSRFATGVVFVVKADSTPYPLARRCLRALHEVEANILGVALNQLDVKRAQRYYGDYSAAYQVYAEQSAATPAATHKPFPA